MVRQPQNQEHYLFGKEDNGKQLRAYKSYLGGSERIEVLSAFSCWSVQMLGGLNTKEAQDYGCKVLVVTFHKNIITVCSVMWWPWQSHTEVPS